MFTATEEATRPVTRIEIADHIDGAFGRGPATKDSILEAARDTQARPEVQQLLDELPERQFSTLRQIWPELPEVPVDA